MNAEDMKLRAQAVVAELRQRGMAPQYADMVEIVVTALTRSQRPHGKALDDLAAGLAAASSGLEKYHRHQQDLDD
jgi:hypothetical protein